MFKFLIFLYNIVYFCTQKPTAQAFYKKLADKSVVLKSIQWIPMKNKMRHLKSSFISAQNWRNQTGAGLLANGEEKSVEEYIEKICPNWNYLEQIFGQRRSVNPSCIIETSVDKDIVDELYVNLIDEEMNTENVPENVLSTSSESSTNVQTSIDLTSLKESMKKQQQQKPKNANPFSLLLSLQEKKLEIEIKKFELEKETAEKEMELKKVQMEQDFEIRKLQLESEERIKKYEIEMKLKTADK